MPIILSPSLDPVEWEACFRTFVLAPSVLSPEDRHLVRDMSLPSKPAVLFNESENRIRNGSGLAFMAKMDKMSEQLDEHGKKLLEHERRLLKLETHFSSEISKIRAIILDSGSNIPTPNNQRHARNAVAHGGNVIADIETILSTQNTNSERADKWQTSFKELYGLPFGTTSLKIFTGHERLIKICNIRANMVITKPWNAEQHVGKKNICDMLLQEWVTETNSAYWDQPIVIQFVDELLEWSNRLLLEAV